MSRYRRPPYLGRIMADRVKAEAESLKGKTVSPIIDAIAFENATRKFGGATMDVKTGDLLDINDPHKDVYLVGKERDENGSPISTVQFADSDFFRRAVNAPSIIRGATGNRSGVNIGSWKTDKGYDIDVSGSYPTEEEGLKEADDRNEKAIFGSKQYRETGNGDIVNPNYDPDRKLPDERKIEYP